MRLNTVATLGASVACAGLAVWLARGWINDAVSEQYAGSPVAAAVDARAAMPSVPVLVTDVELRFGDELSPDVLAVVDYPEGSVPMGAIPSVESLLDGQGRIVALTRINAGEPVLDFKVSLPGSRAALSQIIEPGLRAKAIRVSGAESVAGFVLPGDRVDVLYIRDEEGKTRYGLDMRSDVLLQNVRVLGVDQLMDDQAEGAVVGGNVTLEVSLEDVQKLSIAEQSGTLSLALRAVGETSVEPSAQLRREAILSGPAAPKRRAWRPRSPKPKVTDTTAKVVVIRGDERDTVSVVSEAAPNTELAGG